MRLKQLCAAAALTVAFTSAAVADLEKKQSPYPVAETIERLESVAKNRGLTIFVKIDHAAGAKAAGIDLRPTVLLIFGNATVGTPLMQAEQTMGLSLPLKALAWQDADGKVWLGYDTPADLGKVRGLDPGHPAIPKITAALASIADEALKK